MGTHHKPLSIKDVRRRLWTHVVPLGLIITGLVSVGLAAPYDHAIIYALPIFAAVFGIWFGLTTRHRWYRRSVVATALLVAVYCVVAYK